MADGMAPFAMHDNSRNTLLAGAPRPRRERADLAVLFEEVEAARGRLGITDYAITQATLENVFIQLAGQQQQAGQ